MTSSNHRTGKVLVTGGAGFIGSHTVDELLRSGYEVRVLDSLQERVHPQGLPTWLSPEAEFIKGDVADPTVMEQCLEGVDYVCHLAAYQDYLPDFSRFVHTNTESAALIFEIIVKRGFPIRKIVFASSQSVSGEGSYSCTEHGLVIPNPRSVDQLERSDWEVHCPQCGKPVESQLISEDVSSPITTYGISKYAVELLADRLGRRYDIPTASMRYTYVQGPRNSFYNAYSGIARIFALRIMHGMAPVCFEDGMQLRDYVNVKDIAVANRIVLEDDRANFGVFNAGGGRPISVIEFAQIMLDKFESDMKPSVPGSFRVGDTRHTISDISRLKALGWNPTVSVEESMREYVDWITTQKTSKQYLLEADKLMREQGVVRSAINPTN
jgi:dTDP-L-rhamnose 4-epimerase